MLKYKIPQIVTLTRNNKARAWESLGFAHKKGCVSILTQPPFFEPLVGFEPTTPRLQITCSGQLS